MECWARIYRLVGVQKQNFFPHTLQKEITIYAKCGLENCYVLNVGQCAELGNGNVDGWNISTSEDSAQVPFNAPIVVTSAKVAEFR